jgi:hypothetical protein
LRTQAQKGDLMSQSNAALLIVIGLFSLFAGRLK